MYLKKPAVPVSDDAGGQSRSNVVGLNRWQKLLCTQEVIKVSELQLLCSKLSEKENSLGLKVPATVE